MPDMPVSATLTPQVYVYRVTWVNKVLDGDTYRVNVDVGFYLTTLVEIRLLGYDTPEKVGVTKWEKEHATAAREHSLQWLTAHVSAKDAFVRTERTDDFGRWLGVVFAANGERLGDSLVAEGLASHWPQRWRNVYGADYPIPPGTPLT